MTPEEVWSGHKLNLTHLKVFGSITFWHIPGQLRKKLDDKGEVMLLVCYHPTGGYKLFDVSSKKIVISRDVVVDELKLFDSRNRFLNRRNPVSLAKYAVWKL